MSVKRTTYPSSLIDVSDHNNDLTVLFPHHPPKIIYSVSQGSFKRQPQMIMMIIKIIIITTTTTTTPTVMNTISRLLQFNS